MTADLPAPLVSASVDLTDFEFMPLQVARLRDSDLAGEATGDEFRAAVLLWCVSWHQLPPASLPDNDAALARFAGYGRGDAGVQAWQLVRAGALRGFVLCSDGRLYHPVIADKANEAWHSKLQHRYRRECDRLKKAAQRAQAEFVPPTFAAWLENVERTGSDKYEDVPVAVPNLSQGRARGRGKNVPGDVPEKSAPKGQGEGQCKGQGQGEKKNTPRASASPPADPEGFAEFWAAYPRSDGKKAARKAWAKISPSPDLQQRILAAVAVQARGEDWRRDDGRFVPHAATWLNGERWTDGEAKAGAAGGAVIAADFGGRAALPLLGGKRA